MQPADSGCPKEQSRFRKRIEHIEFASLPLIWRMIKIKHPQHLSMRKAWTDSYLLYRIPQKLFPGTLLVKVVAESTNDTPRGLAISGESILVSYCFGFVLQNTLLVTNKHKSSSLSWQCERKESVNFIKQLSYFRRKSYFKLTVSFLLSCKLKLTFPLKYFPYIFHKL